MTCKIFHIYDTFQKIPSIYLRSYYYYFTLRHNFLYADAAYTHSKYLKKRSFGMSMYGQSKTSLMIFKNYFPIIFFLVSTLNSMGGVLCSIIVSERFKIRKSLAINYWQDTMSGVEVYNNAIKSINFEKFQLVL